MTRHAPTLRTTLAAVVVGCAVAAAPALAQDLGPETKYWPLAKINFPIDTARVANLNPRPSALRFYSALPNKAFQLVAEKKLEDLDEIQEPNNPRATPKRGFSYTSKEDGAFEFALQYVFADGTVSPPTTQLAPQYKVIFDVTPPKVDVLANGGNGVRWQASDANLSAGSIRLEGHYVGEGDWAVMRTTRELGAEDKYEWNVPEGKTLEVRVSAKDKAGHLGHSAAVKLTGKGGLAVADGTPFPKAGGVGGSTSGSGFGAPGDLQTSRIEYVNSTQLKVRSKITHVTRSGVKESLLFVNEGTADWKPAGKKAVDIKFGDADPVVELEYDAKKDGRYGFIVQPVSGAGTKPDDPRPNEPAQYLVEVDTTRPVVTLKSARAVPGGLNGPLVEIEYLYDEKNKLNEPITIEYSDNLKDWKTIAAKVPYTGKYTWEVTDKALWKVWLRVTGDDQAGNSAFAETPVDKPVLIDLDKPAATVEKVNRSGDAPPPPPKSRSNKEVMAPAAEPMGSIPIVGLPTRAEEPNIGVRPASPVKKDETPAAVPVVPKVDDKKPEPKPAEEKKPELPAVAPPPIALPPAGTPLPVPELPPSEKK